MSYNQEYDYLIKLLLIGNANTEKSSLLDRFAENVRDDNFVPTIGIDFVRINIILNFIYRDLKLWKLKEKK